MTWITTKEAGAIVDYRPNSVMTALRKYGPKSIVRPMPGNGKSKQIHLERFVEWWPKYLAGVQDRLKMGRAKSGWSRRGHAYRSTSITMDKDFSAAYKDKHLLSVCTSLYGTEKGQKTARKLRRKSCPVSFLQQVDTDARERLDGREYCQWHVLAAILGVYS